MTETLQEWLRAQCNRHVNGACTTARCLRRGGWIPGAPQSADAATCEAHEAADALDAKDAEIAALREKVEWGDKSCEAWRSDYTELQATLAALRARIASAEALLREIASWKGERGVSLTELDDLIEKARAHFAKWEKPDASS